VIRRTKSIGLNVRDQQAAVDFFVGKLGFELRRDEPMGSDTRWIELAPPGAETVLVPFTPPGLEDRIGSFSGIVFECDGVERTHAELRAQGVEFVEEPTRQSWGMWAQFKDPEGNVYALLEPDEQPG
jgi:catechol 2,3-dioxygenase-like lactoylglutathione lyase family enzyme